LRVHNCHVNTWPPWSPGARSHGCTRPPGSHKPHQNSRERALRGARRGRNRDESHRRAICQIAGLDEVILARNCKPALGIDVARYGNSETVITQREGGWARIAWAGGKLSTMETIGHVVRVKK
jgi:hypothetical protein